MEKVTIIFATNNANKAREVKTLLPKKFTLKTLADIGFAEEIEETEKTLEGNASLKSQAIFNSHSCNVFSDDTGLEVDALNGEPGVFSARYAKMQGYADGNMNFLLEKLKDISNRKARFRTIISLILNGKEYLFEGIVNGEIAMSKEGNSGFGYDPIFKPIGYDCTFAQMTEKEKSSISHRGLALAKMVSFLENQ